MNLIYKCPVCSKELKKTDRAFSCDQGHSFDISRQGYVNLLLANQKKTREPGDSKEMIANREYFLEKGYYDILSNKLNEIILGWIDQSSTSFQESKDKINVLDLGCGEGFYSARLKSSLHGHLNNSQLESQVKLWGVDISRAAIQKAAKRDSNIQFCIASNFQLPYRDESLDIVFSVFSPFDLKELLRVLKPRGKIIVVRPGTNHLKELVSLFYQKFELQGDASSLMINSDLQPSQIYEVKYQTDLKNTRDIESLIGMTPYFWTLNEEKKQLLAQQQELIITVDFQLLLFEK